MRPPPHTERCGRAFLGDNYRCKTEHSTRMFSPGERYAVCPRRTFKVDSARTRLLCRCWILILAMCPSEFDETASGQGNRKAAPTWRDARGTDRKHETTFCGGLGRGGGLSGRASQISRIRSRVSDMSCQLFVVALRLHHLRADSGVPRAGDCFLACTMTALLCDRRRLIEEAVRLSHSASAGIIWVARRLPGVPTLRGRASCPWQPM